MTPTDTHVTLHTADDGRPLLRLEHRYAHPVRRVWQALTDGAEHARWFGVRIEIEPVVGGVIRFWFCEQPTEGRVLEAQPPRLLVHTGRGDVFRWGLAPDADGCVLVLLDTVDEPAHLPWSAAGFHSALDLLELHLDGGEPDTADQGDDTWFDKRVAHYTRILRPDHGRVK